MWLMKRINIDDGAIFVEFFYCILTKVLLEMSKYHFTELWARTFKSSTYLIFVNFGTPAHFLGPQKVQHDVH